MNVNTLPLLPHQQASRGVELRYRNFHELLKTKADEAPAREFLVFPESDRKYSYREFYELSLGAAEWLGTRAKDGSTTCIVFRNTPEFLAIFFGAVFRGMTVVPVNPDLAAPEIRFIVENSDSTTVFYDPALKAKLAGLESDMFSAVRFLPFGDVADLPKIDVAAVEARLPQVEPTTPAAIIYTSGT